MPVIYILILTFVLLFLGILLYGFFDNSLTKVVDKQQERKDESEPPKNEEPKPVEEKPNKIQL